MGPLPAVSIDDAPQRAVGRVALAGLQISCPPLLSHFPPKFTITPCHVCAITINPSAWWPCPASRKTKPNPVCQVPRWLPRPAAVLGDVQIRGQSTAHRRPRPMENRFGAGGNWEGGNAAGRSGISGSKEAN